MPTRLPQDTMNSNSPPYRHGGEAKCAFAFPTPESSGTHRPPRRQVVYHAGLPSVCRKHSQANAENQPCLPDRCFQDGLSRMGPAIPLLPGPTKARDPLIQETVLWNLEHVDYVQKNEGDDDRSSGHGFYLRKLAVITLEGSM